LSRGGNYSAGKRERDAEKAQRLIEKAERRALKRARGPRAEEFTTLEAVVGNMPTTEQALRRMELRGASSRGVAPLPCRLYVGGLSFDTRDQALREAFEQHGPVLEAVVVQDRATGKSRGFGFVTMANRKDAPKTIEALNGSELDGRSLVVRIATDR
jgi:RNA recognition motif-containing protein